MSLFKVGVSCDTPTPSRGSRYICRHTAHPTIHLNSSQKPPTSQRRDINGLLMLHTTNLCRTMAQSDSSSNVSLCFDY